MRPIVTLPTFLLMLTIYHVLDFAIEHTRSGSKLSLDALLLSPWYCGAMALCLIEYAVEYWLFPSWKSSSRLSTVCYIVGTLGMAFGDGLRKASMIHNKSFTHVITQVKRKDHRLVTSGPYRVWRHPGYAGWYYWSLSSQLLLQNPISLVVFAFVGSRFFRERIPYEEDTLATFFGREYAAYASRTGIWIPGVKGSFPYKPNVSRQSERPS